MKVLMACFEIVINAVDCLDLLKMEFFGIFDPFRIYVYTYERDFWPFFGVFRHYLGIRFQTS
jgi:hypothetical protein